MTSFLYGRMRSRTHQWRYQQDSLIQVTKANINFDSCVLGYIIKNSQCHRNDKMYINKLPHNTY